ncbi:MAG: YfhO family protein [Methylocella sp.]
MSFFDTTGNLAASASATHLRQGFSEATERFRAQAWTREASLFAVASLIGFYALALACWLLSETVVPWDSKNHFYPMFRFLGDALQRGEIPLWNPYHFAGHPAVADPQSLLFTPSMALFALIAPNASMQLFDAVIFAHLAAGGLCVLGLFRRWRWHPAGAVLAALIFMLGGAASSRLQHTGMIISYSFFPAALWSFEIALERRSYRFALLFGVCAALMALGRDQVAFLLCMVLVGRVIFAVVQSGRALAYLHGRLGVLAVGVIVIGCILVVPALLTMQFLGDSNRPGIAFGVAAAGSLAPVNLITLFVPNFFGSLDHLYDYWGPDYDTMPRADWTDRAVDYLFIGTLPILLIVWHGFGAGRLFACGIRFFLIIFGAAMLYALGRYTPFFGLAFDWVPGVSLYRRPADATFILNIALAFGAGYLLHRYVVEGIPTPFATLPKWLAFAFAAITALGIAVLIGSGLAFSLRESRVMTSLVQLGVAAVFCCAGVGLLIGLRSAKHRALAASLFVVLSGGEILWRNAASSLNAEPIDRYSVYAKMKPSEAAGIEILRKEIAAKTRDGEHPRVEILGLGGPWQNASMALKFENTIGYNPLRIDGYERAVGPGDNAGDPNLRHFPGTFRGYKCRLAALLGLEYLVLDRPLTRLPRHVPRPVATLIFSSDAMYIYKLGKAAPRVYFATKIKTVDSEQVLDEHVLPDFDRTRAVLIDQSSVADLRAVRDRVADEGFGATVAEAPDQSHASIAAYADNSVAIDVDADQAGIVVLHDLFYPGWQVKVDGKQQPVLHANILFRGVEVPAGRHRVEFEFHPLSFANLSAAVSTVLNRNRE